MNQQPAATRERSASELFAAISSYDHQFLSIDHDPHVRERWEELMRFVALSTATAKSYPMASPGIDEVWHTFILHTERYVDFCTTFLGEYFHHRPRSLEALSAVSLAEFRSDYEQAFGRSLSPLWNSFTADCSSCGGSGCSH